ncbi:Asp-tRNA(Asn)/Glu-tRNA(Gln) amidotransferase subunit GatC [Candidatus Peregrinibacteria bacterium]|nr:Asp-tRNA(Asn)/Glu-tRNA(Gln) amidotransferase subunit GatC [Candidatus Peregrinibacteria bacterium]
MLSEDQVKHIARLSRLGLTDAEIKKFSSQLTGILEYMDILNEVDTKDVEPTSQVTGLENVLREDEARDWVKGEELLASSPLEKQNNQIKVKPVLAEPEDK